MTISDSIPVQFWSVDDETFNEKEICGVMPDCFCQPWNCDDEIIIQIQDTGGQDLELSIFDSDGNLLYSVPFEEVETGVYYLAFVPSELSPELCNKQVQLKLQGASSPVMDETSSQVTGWSNSGSGRDWLVPPYQLNSNIFRSAVITPEIESGSNIRIDVNIFAGHADKHLFVTLRQSTGTATQVIDFGSSLSSGVNSEEVTADNDYDQVDLFVQANPDATILQITNISITLVEGLGTVVLSNKTFDTSLSPWANVEGFDTPIGPEWQWSSEEGGSNGMAYVMLSGSGVYSDFLEQELPSTIPSGAVVSIDITVGGTDGGNRQMLVHFWDGSTLQEIDSISNISNGTHTFSGTLSINATHIRIEVNSSSATTLTILEVSDIEAGNETPYTIPNGDFSTTSDWINIGTDGYNWRLLDSFTARVFVTGNFKRVFFEGGNKTSKILRKALSISGGNRLDYEIIMTSEGTDLEINGTVELRKSGAMVHSFVFNMVGEGPFVAETQSGTFNLTDDIDEVVVYGENVGGEDVYGLVITKITFEVSETIIKSDCLSIKESHSCTELIQYTNSADFDDIIYETSPQPVFNIRVPAQFWKEDNPQEQEDMELSNNEIITLKQHIQEKRLLEIGYVPNYFHKKIQKILMHDTVTIDSTNWKKRDEYESENLSRYPKKVAQVWLTKYNSVERNTL